MILQCPRCLTKWRVDASLLDSNGSAVRCSRCGEEFSAFPPPPAAGRLAQEKDQEPDWQKSSPERQELKEFLAEEGPAAEAESMSEAVTQKKKSSKRRSAFRIWLIIPLVLLILIGGSLGAVLVMKNRGVHWDRQYLGVDLYQWVERLKSNVTGGGDKTSMTEKPALRISGAAEVVEAAYRRLESKSAGSLHVISGVIKNLTETAISEIVIEGVLLSRQNETVLAQTTYAGATIPDKILQQADRKSLTAVITAWSRSGGPGITVESGGTAPFVLIFLDVPREAKSYRVEVGSVYPGVNRRKPVGLVELLKAVEGDGGRISDKIKSKLGG